MKKKWLLALFLLLGLTSTTACSIIDTPTEKNKQQMTSVDKEKLYRELASLTRLPKDIKHSSLFNKQLSFVAKAAGEPYQMESKDETLHNEWYVPVFLMRNQTTPIYLNVSKIKKEKWPNKGEIVRVEGIPIGYLYTSFNNKRLDLLDMKAKNIEQVTLSDKKVVAEKKIETEFYRIEFTSYAGLMDTFQNPSFIVYYTFKNKATYRMIPPLKTYFLFSQKDELLETTFMDSTNHFLDPKALNRDSLESGEEMLFYEAFKLKDAESSVMIHTYDDEYTLINKLEIPVPKIEAN